MALGSLAVRMSRPPLDTSCCINASGIRRSTADLIRYRVRQLASALVHANVMQPDQMVSLAALITPATVHAGLVFLIKRARGEEAELANSRHRIGHDDGSRSRRSALRCGAAEARRVVRQGRALQSRASPANPRSMPFAAWPQRDRLAWLAAIAQGDDGSAWSGGIARRCAGAPAQGAVPPLLRNWLAWLVVKEELDPQQPPGERVTRQRLSTYLKAQRALGVGAKTIENQAVSLRHMFEALSPERDWRWMLPMIRKIKAVAMVTKNHSDLPSIHEFVSSLSAST